MKIACWRRSFAAKSGERHAGAERSKIEAVRVSQAASAWYVSAALLTGRGGLLLAKMGASVEPSGAAAGKERLLASLAGLERKQVSCKSRRGCARALSASETGETGVGSDCTSRHDVAVLRIPQHEARSTSLHSLTGRACRCARSRQDAHEDAGSDVAATALGGRSVRRDALLVACPSAPPGSAQARKKRRWQSIRDGRKPGQQRRLHDAPDR